MKTKMASIPFEVNNIEGRIMPFRQVVYVNENPNGTRFYYSDDKLTDQVNLPDNTDLIYTRPELLYGMSDIALPSPAHHEVVQVEKPGYIKKLRPFDYAAYIVSQIPLKKYNSELYVYRDGCYHAMSKPEVCDLVMDYCGADIIHGGSPSVIDKVVSCLNNLPGLRCQDNDVDPDFVPFRNGIFNIRDFSFYPYETRPFVRYALTVDFDPMNGYCPEFLNYLNTVTGYDPVMKTRILEIMGYLLTAHTDAKKFFVFAGVGNSGKSLLINLIESLITPDSIFSAGMNELGLKFTLGYMNGKHLSICSDLSSAPITNSAVGNIKMLTGGDTKFCEKKQAAMVRMEKTTRLLFSTNHEITTVYHDQAFMDRCCVVPFLHSIPVDKQDPFLFAKLMNERTAIVNYALNAYISLRLRRYRMGVEFTGEAEAQKQYHEYFHR